MQRNPLLEALKSLKQAESELIEKLKPIQESIASLEKTIAANTSSDTKEYNPNWSASNKFLYLLKTYNRFLHFREAADLIIELEGGSEKDAKDLVGKLSSGTTLLKNGKQIVKYKAGKSNQDTFWGVPKWLDEKGNVKPEHTYNKEYLSDGKKNTPLFEI